MVGNRKRVEKRGIGRERRISLFIESSETSG
jgi:hypothetical protein